MPDIVGVSAADCLAENIPSHGKARAEKWGWKFDLCLANQQSGTIFTFFLWATYETCVLIL